MDNVSNAPTIKETANTYIPLFVLWVKSLIQPTKYGLTNPARLPNELIKAIPAAAAVPPKMAVGRLQNNGKVVIIPSVATVSAHIAAVVLAL